MEVKIIPALNDNYMYLIIDSSTKKAAVVDPVDPNKVLNAVAEEEVQLAAVLTTHHHFDHAGGNKKLVAKVGKDNISVYGGDDRIYGVTDETKVAHDITIQLGSLVITCLKTPCHTTGHICYYIQNDNNSSVFTGDTLFLAGCGKFFEGTGVEMYHSLVTVLSKLPGNTKVYCGHEYSLSNLKFAAHVEPQNSFLKDKLVWAQERRDKGLTTMPSTIDEELKYNPFMRVDTPEMQKRCGTQSGVETMNYLRNEKDNFSPLTIGTVFRFAYWYLWSHYQNLW